MPAILRHIYLTIILLTAMLPTVSHAQIDTRQVLRVGQNALYFEDYVLSIQYFNQVIQAKPYLAQPYLYRAIAKFNLEDYTGAADDASKALEINPYIPDAWEVRGVARQNLGMNAEAVADYDAALGLLPRNRQILFNKAMALSDLGEYDRADTTFTEVLEHYPGFDNGYIGRAKLRLERGDTVGASADIEKALAINNNAVNAHIIRAHIAINSHGDYEQALSDMDEAVKLQPRMAGLYINRAFLRHELNDYFGAMADYDYALQLDPMNDVALFNRGLLRMEVGDDDLALLDFTKVLELDPDNYRALYNRAVLEGQKHEFDKAIDDLDKVIERFPDFAGAYYMRSSMHEGRGDIARSKRDYDKAMALTAPGRHKDNPADDGAEAAGADTPDSGDIPPELVARRFNNLLTIDNDTHIDEEYNNSAIRGKVQDRDLAIEAEPIMELSFYSSPTEVHTGTYYIKDVEELNATHQLRRMIQVVSKAPLLFDEEMIQDHFSSVDYYNSYISTHTPRAVDYIGRAMEFLTLRNYPSALSDLNRAIELTPDYALAYMLRAQARYKNLAVAENRSRDLTLVLADTDEALRLSPRTAPLWFNRGDICLELGDTRGAIEAFTRAIELQPEMGEAYYNRGYAYFKDGNLQAGSADLSKAGELGIVAAYNLMKRISRSM